MNKLGPKLICLIEEDSDIRDTLITALSSQGYLTNGFRNFPDALNFLYKSLSPLSLLLANNSYSFHEWLVFKSELNQIERMKEAQFHTYYTPVNLSHLLDEITVILKN